MTKLYNFAAIDEWSGKIVERLHGGVIRFRPGFHEGLRMDLHELASWDTAEFRCLHLCFLNRSSREQSAANPRRNIMDRHARSFAKTWSRLRSAFGGKPAKDWKEQKYARGPLEKKSIAPFLSIHP